MTRREGLRVPDLFSQLDADSSGWISHNEMKRYLVKMNVDLNDRQITTLMDSFDKDANGSIQYKEFLRAITSRVV